MYVSDLIGVTTKGHHNFEFVDIFLNDDNEIFIDPLEIERGTSDWHKASQVTMSSYFDNLFVCMRSSNAPSYSEVFTNASEINATKLGYGNGRNGKGKTARGLQESFSGLNLLANEVATINRPEDLLLLVRGFDKDCMSDLLTNILQGLLNSFTSDQMKQYGIPPDTENKLTFWCPISNDWKIELRSCWLYEGKELLLVPKSIVRKNFIFSVNQYVQSVIIERIRNEKNWFDMTKKDITDNLPKRDECWRYDLAIDYTKRHPDALLEYHKLLPSRYRERGNISDSELDKIVYRNIA